MMTIRSATIRILLFYMLVFGGHGHAATAPLPAPPSVSAQSYILLDYDSDYILADKNSDKRMEPASITKVMSAYVIFGELQAGRLKLEDLVNVSERAWRMPGSRTFIEVGSKVAVGDLLNGIIIQSGNDATVALAEHIAGSEDTFASLMNQQAKRLGLSGTHFVNSTGLPHSEHYSTARDIATLGRAIIHDYPEYYSYYSKRKYVYNGISQYNRNKLLWRDDAVDGIKTGHTDAAGYCLLSSAKKNGMRLISVVLEDKSENARAVSSLALLNYGFRFYETRQLYKLDDTLKAVRVWKGSAERLPLGLQQTLYVTFPRGRYDQLEVTIDLQKRILAPVKQYQSFGTLNVSLDNKVIAEQPLVALQTVPKGSLWRQLVDTALLWLE